MSIPVPHDAHETFRRYLSAVVLSSMAQAEVLGMHPTDMYAYNLLDLTGPMTAGALAEQTGLTTGATTRLIDRMERQGRVRRVPDPADRRRVLVEAVPDPALESGEVFGPARQRMAEVFLQYDAAQLALLFEFFAKSTQALRTATEEIRRLA